MSIFDGGKGKQIEKLITEHETIISQIDSLQNQIRLLQSEINKRTSDDEKEARQHSKKASEFRNKIEYKLEEATGIVNNLQLELESVRGTKNEINNINAEVVEQKGEVALKISELENDEVEYQKSLTNLKSQIKIVDETFERYPDLNEQLESLVNLSNSTEENFKKSGSTLNHINNRKEEIDDLHRELFGYTEKDGEEEIVIEGLRSKLQGTYNKLEKNLGASLENIGKLETKYKNSYSSFESSYKSRYKKINDDIEALLPAALTAGLSSAFSKKKEDEVELSLKLQKRFTYGIYGLIGASMIPVFVSIVFLWQNIELVEVINRIPRLVLAIVPLYIPILWFTYSANKKLNLSKRLIEEYSHKEVLSRTYEGLSKQIEGLEDPNQSEELRFRLLSSFLQVSSENPGKLISNYEASDHPVMEALEQSYKFQIAIDKLEGVPGLGKVAALLEKNAKKKLQVKEEKIKQTLESERNVENKDSDE